MSSFILSGKSEAIVNQLKTLEGFESRAYQKGFVDGFMLAVKALQDLEEELKQDQEREQYQAWQGTCESRE